MNEFLDLHALADGELDTEQAAALKLRIAADPKLRREHEAILNLKDFVREKSLKFESEESWKACVGRLNEIDRSSKVTGFVNRYAWVFCGTLFAVIVGARFLVKDVRGDSVRAADIGHIFPASAPQAPVDAGQIQYYKDMLKIGHIAANQVRLVAPPTQSVVGDGIPITRFNLSDEQGPMQLYVVQAQVNFEDVHPLTANPDVSEGVIAGAGRSINCLIWNTNGRTLVLAADRQESDLEQARSEIVNPSGS